MEVWKPLGDYENQSEKHFMNSVSWLPPAADPKLEAWILQSQATNFKVFFPFPMEIVSSCF